MERKERKNKCIYCEIDYYVLSGQEAEEKCEDCLDVEYWKLAVESGQTTEGYDEWKKQVINIDGYGQILNGYDGTEYFDAVNDVYIMRC